MITSWSAFVFKYEDALEERMDGLLAQCYIVRAFIDSLFANSGSKQQFKKERFLIYNR